MDVQCPYSKHKQQGYTEWKECTIINDYCHYMRRCPTKNEVVHSQGAVTCPIRLKESEKKEWLV